MRLLSHVPASLQPNAMPPLALVCKDPSLCLTSSLAFNASDKHAITAQSGRVDTRQAHLIWTFCNFQLFPVLLPYNVFCLQLAPVPERAPAQRTTRSPEGERVGVKERERETDTQRQRK